MISPKSAPSDSALNLAFDIGHSSIGWAVLQPPAKKSQDPSLLGCGVVLFPPDDCLNSTRAVFRRQRRHIAATRNRIKRLKLLLQHLGVLKTAELDQHPSPYSSPWLFAARVLASNGQQTLSWPELWAVLRWYAHNRGYDGNVAWARDEEPADEDSEKEKNALGLMGTHGKETMAETMCADLGLDPLGTKFASTKYFKGNNAAFPRRVVVSEARRLLELHRGKLQKLDDAFIAALLEDWEKIPCPAIHLPKRYAGGLLFGQMIPRFDNRIIPTCRITGQKTPLKHCRAFYRYRWAMLVKNLRVNDPAGPHPLAPFQRRQLHMRMELAGSFSKTELKKALAEITQAGTSQLEQMFLTPETEKALVHDPVKKVLAQDHIAPLWALIPPKFQKIFAGRLFHDTRATLADWQAAMENAHALPSKWSTALETAAEVKRSAKQKKNREGYTTAIFLHEPITIPVASGRAPYTRELMEQAFDYVFADHPAPGDPTAKGGPIEETDAVLTRRLKQPIASQTNNHLVRHRLLILERTLADLVKKYAEGDPKRVAKVTIEVVRDLQQFSGKSAKEKEQILGQKLSHHRRIVKKLEEAKEECNGKFEINYSLIKKARIADDLGWKCPYTGMDICVADLLPTGTMDREHIIPKKLRPSDSLESLVITYKAVNKMKGARTAVQFMKEDGGNSIPSLPGKELLPYKKFAAFVESLPPKYPPGRGASDDQRRCWRRKEFLLLEKFDSRDSQFTGRDLTQTSHLVKLANLQAQAWFKHKQSKPEFEPLPGSVTGATRRSWDLLGCLAQACPRILDENGKPRIKAEIRDLTHLHHAVDAAVLAFAAHYLPRDGNVWNLLNRRTVDAAGRRLLEATGRFTFAEGNRPRLEDLPKPLKQQLTDCLAEKRVVQHVPKKMSGLKVQQNIWRVAGPADDEGFIPLRQAIRGADGKRVPKFREERPAKLHGFTPSGPPAQAKLAKLKGVFIIEENYGIALDPEPQVIPFTHVQQTLRELSKKNSGASVRVLRKGMVIQIPKGNYQGRWRIHSVKDANFGIGVDMASPEIVKAENKTPGCKMNVSVKTLLRDGLVIVDTSYAGA